MEQIICIGGSIMWPFYLTTPMTYTYDLELVKFEFALSEGQWTWNERCVNLSFMTIILTFVWPWWGGWIDHRVTALTSYICGCANWLVMFMHLNLLPFCIRFASILHMLVHFINDYLYRKTDFPAQRFKYDFDMIPSSIYDLCVYMYSVWNSLTD